jgi:hypothetical protein
MMMASVRRRCFFASASGARGSPVLSGALVLALIGSWARADVIVLRGGGQVTGKVRPDPQNKDRVQVWLLQGRKPLSLLKSQIVEVTPKASPLDTYFEKLSKVTATAQAEYELALWCEQNKLNDLARQHFEAALVADKSFVPAHKKLGHVFHDGYWLSRDDLNAVQGLVKYKGRWISTEERAKHQAEEAATATQNTWIRRIKILRQAIVNGPENRRREAEVQLMAIRDAEAVMPLLRVFGNDEPEMRILLAHVLSKIEGKEATFALVKQMLAEPTEAVRPVIFDKLKSRDDPAVVIQLVRALTAADIQVINRAAWTLGNLEAVEVVPRLIPALLSYEQRIVTPPIEGSTVLASGMSGLVPIAHSPNFNNMAFMTPPVVSAGAVAYGVTSGPTYGPGATSLAVGGPAGGLTIRAPEPRVVTYTFRNTEVLAALQKLTGQDFGYDIASWKHWTAHDFNPAPKPARRVVEP